MGGDDKTAKPNPDGDKGGEGDGKGSGSAVSAPVAPLLPAEVVVHPLVLLSVVDHYNRVAKDTRKRVVGVLLGESYKARLRCVR